MDISPQLHFMICMCCDGRWLSDIPLMAIHCLSLSRFQVSNIIMLNVIKVIANYKCIVRRCLTKVD